MRFITGLLFVALTSTAFAAEPAHIRMAGPQDIWPAYLAAACAQGGPLTVTIYGMTSFPYGFVDPHSGAVGFIDCVDGKLTPWVPKK